MNILVTTMPVEITKKRDVISWRVAPTSAIYLLASILLEHKYNTKVLDPYIIQSEVNYSNLYSVVGKYTKDIDICCMSSNTLNWAMTKKVVEIIRKQKGDKIKIILGGLQVSNFYEHIIKTTDADYILRGDGEETLPQLIHAIESGSGFENIKGLVQKNGKITSTNMEVPSINNEIYKDIPLPNYDLMPKKVYNMLPIETSRGCKFACRFCSVPHHM